jgi:hypothetical protein
VHAQIVVALSAALADTVQLLARFIMVHVSVAGLECRRGEWGCLKKIVITKLMQASAQVCVPSSNT